MTFEEARQRIEKIAASLGDLSMNELEEIAILASDLRSQAWTIRAMKLAIDVAED